VGLVVAAVAGAAQAVGGSYFQPLKKFSHKF